MNTTTILKYTIFSILICSLFFSVSSTASAVTDIITDGKVGIGVTSPTESLHVNGNAKLIGTGRYLMSGGVYIPSLGGQDFRVLTTSSSATSATNEGLRTSTWNFFDNTPDDIDNAVIAIDQIQRTNPLSGTLKKTGIHVKQYTQPDNGGDVSAGLFVQTGGGGALTAYKVSSTHRPAGFTNYESSPQGALEVGTSDQSQAALFIAGAFNTTNASNAIYARVDNAASKGILVAPGDGVFDSRIGYAIGGQTIGGADSNIKFSVDLSGNLFATQGRLYGAGQATSTPTTSSDLGGSLRLQDSGGLAGNGGMLVFGFNQGNFASIKGYATDGSSNTLGDLIFNTRNAAADSTLSERLRIKYNGNVGIGTNDPHQKLEINGGVQLNTVTAKPTCDAAARGTQWFTQGTTGVKDTLEVCAKDAGNSYAWRTLY
jgi:hypothetical protein